MALEAKIKSHLAQGAFDTAFQMALNANNLQLVLQVCGMVNPVQIFSTPCQLSQSCLLSLISQLSK